MKTTQNFWIYYFLLLIAQVIICGNFQISPYLVLSFLPAIIICIPLSVNTIGCMLIAFASGLAVDWLSEGLIGINAAAAVPVAFARKFMIRVFLGEDLISRNDSFSFRKNGAAKITTMMMLGITLFLSVYIILDGAGTRPLWFNFARFGISLSASLPLSLAVTGLLTPEDRR